MGGRLQLETSVSENSRVKLAHFDCEGDLVYRPLPVWLRLGPKLKVFWSVVISLAVFVMHRFVIQKLAADSLFHQPSVLVNKRSRAGLVQVSRNRNPDVSLLAVGAGCFLRVKLSWVSVASVFRSAYGAAQSLRPRKSPILFPEAWDFFAALFAVLSLKNVLLFASPDPAALGRAIYWVSSPLNPVAPEFARAAHKRSAALFASECDPLNVLRASVVRVVAGLRAEFAVLGRSAVEFNSALRTFLHLFALVLGYNFFYQNHLTNARGAC